MYTRIYIYIYICAYKYTHMHMSKVMWCCHSHDVVQLRYVILQLHMEMGQRCESWQLLRPLLGLKRPAAALLVDMRREPGPRRSGLEVCTFRVLQGLTVPQVPCSFMVYTHGPQS